MGSSRVTVFGGSGFLGRQIVSRLANHGADVRVAVRHPERASFLERGDRAGQITAVYADVWEEASVGAGDGRLRGRGQPGWPLPGAEQGNV